MVKGYNYDTAVRKYHTVCRVASGPDSLSDYYPYGLPHASATSPEANRRKYGAKELTTDLGLNLYDFAARFQNPAFPHFTTPDPLAEKYYPFSPYLYCGGDPINRIDPTGLGDFWFNGKIIGTDGIDDGMIYVVRDANSSSESNAGISKDEVKETVNFIKKHNMSQTQEEIANSTWVYENCVIIENSASNRQSMIDHVYQDKGVGGTKDSNNREHGGYIKDGKIIFEESGEVADPSVSPYASIKITSGYPSFHSHPSGTKIVLDDPTQKDNHTSQSSVTFGSERKTIHGFIQNPSDDDIKNAGNHTCYVFGMGDKKVYIYNSKGIQAIMPMKRFVKPKK